MSTAEILDYMKLRLDLIASQGAPGYDDLDYSIFFNKAQKVYVRSLYEPLANPQRVGAEESERRSKQLSQLKSETPVISAFVVASRPYSYFANIPVDLWVCLSERAIATYIDKCGNTSTCYPNVKPIKEDYYAVNKDNPYKKPYEKTIWRLDRERSNINLETSPTNFDRHELIIGSSMTLTGYQIVYYRNPKTVDLTNINDFCELDPMTHDAISDIAVELMMQTTERQSLQTKMMENQSSIQ